MAELALMSNTICKKKKKKSVIESYLGYFKLAEKHECGMILMWEYIFWEFGYKTD